MDVIWGWGGLGIIPMTSPITSPPWCIHFIIEVGMKNNQITCVRDLKDAYNQQKYKFATWNYAILKVYKMQSHTIEK